MGDNDDDDCIYLLVSSFHDRKSSSHSSGGQKSKMQVLAGWFHLRVARVNLPPQAPSCLHPVFPLRVCLWVSLSPLIRTQLYRIRAYPNDLIFFLINYFNWRLITLRYCGGFCHTFTSISHGCTCVPHPEPPPTSLPIPFLRIIPVHQP